MRIRLICKDEIIECFLISVVSFLGKQFKAKAIEERCGIKITCEEKKRKKIYEKSPSIELLIDDLPIHYVSI